jgi:uncharacterized membrane-anchored protein
MTPSRPSKVPEITIAFWCTKILTTGMGETTSDFLFHQLNPFLVIGLDGVGLASSLALQFAVRRYIPWVYWLAVAMVSVFGTMVADVLHVAFHVPDLTSTIVFSLLLPTIFVAWYKCERTLSVHSIATPRREAFYWAVVLATFALGTAAGDTTASTLNLGFFASGVLFAVIIAIPAVLFWSVGLNAVFAFWFAYVVTRPLGASFADWMGAAADRGGLSLGAGPISLALACMIALMVGSQTISKRSVRLPQQIGNPMEPT